MCNKYASIKIPDEHMISVTDFHEFYSVKSNSDQSLLIDVRSKVQYGIVNIPGSINIPVSALKKDPSSLLQLSESKDKVFILCRKGNASREATEFLLG
jgi:adenylyltransferase/sulfurtransferase